MKHSIEHLSDSSNMDISNDPEGINENSNAQPDYKTFEEHMKELNKLIDDLPTKDEKEIDNAIENLAREQAIKDARAAVMRNFEHPATSEPSQTDGPTINLTKNTKKTYDENGNIVEKYIDYTKTNTSRFNRYPTQIKEANKLMHESYEQGRPLKVLNIGVSQGQEALSYIQMASNLAGEDKISDALDLELVEYDVEIPITKDKLPENISESSRDYLKNLYQTEKAHFGTLFQEYVKELKEKGEKRDVVLFNNVIQHLDYSHTPDEMLKDMENLADIVNEGGMLCMTCDPKKYPKVNEHIERTKEMLKNRGFYEESEGIFKLP